jgi:UDP-glucose 4-epimerase
MRTLVTGGAGFIGSNLVDALLERGDEVTVVDDLSTGRRQNLEGALAAGAELVEADIRKAAALADVAERVKPDTVFHLAAQIDVRRSVAEPDFDAGINVGGTANVLEAARRAGAGRFVFVSTGGAI